MAIGVFGLQVAYKLKRLEVMSTTNTHGWFGGGSNNPGNLSTVDRIDFSNDTGTANIRGSLSVARYLLAATGNSNYGWFGGGNSQAPVVRTSTVDRIDFSNDSSTASVRGPLSSVRYCVGATGNSNYGWFGGGLTGTPGTPLSTVDRINFSNDSGTTSPRGPLSLARGFMGATGNSNYGWFGGGTTFPGPLVSTVDRIDFSNDSSTASPRNPLNSPQRSSLTSTGNSNYGWWAGGFSPSSPTSIYYSTVNRIDFSNDSQTANIRGPLSAARQDLSATGNSNYGWFGGALFPSPSSRVDRIDFSNDSVSASVRGPLSSSKYGSGATSGQAKGPAIKLQKAGNYGWFGGGNPSIPSTATVDRINFSNDLNTALVRGSLTQARGALSATGNSNYGWFAAGYVTVTTVDRIDFSNDSPTLSVRGSLIQGRSSSIATGNSNYGWFGGGTQNPGSITTVKSIVERVDFSNDLTTASLRGSLSQARQSLAATGNSNYGWFIGGFNIPAIPAFYSTVDRIDFSNDGITASPRTPLIAGRTELAATGNSNYGWFSGGSNPGTVSSINRIDFSNDSATASPRGILTQARYNLIATGNSNYGWFGGGSIPVSTAVSTVNRIDFSNDLGTASAKSPLSESRSNLAATSNSTR